MNKIFVSTQFSIVYENPSDNISLIWMVEDFPKLISKYMTVKNYWKFYEHITPNIKFTIEVESDNIINFLDPLLELI